MKKMTDYDKGLKEATIELTSALKAVDGALKKKNGGRSMKITVTETKVKTIIEADMDELRASNSVADSFSNMLRRAFNNVGVVTTDDEEEEEDGSEE